MAPRKPKYARPVRNSAKQQHPANARISHGARSLAIDVLNRADPRRNYAAPILNNLLDRTDQRQRATDLVFGTIRHRWALDTAITAFSSRPTERIPLRLLNIIRLGAYELIYRPETPDYSIVSEAVENTKARSGKKQVGFVNAVLRNITRQIVDRQGPLADADIRAVLPQNPSTGCVFKTAFLPDPHANPADYLSTAFSLPIWLITVWLAEFGFEKTRRLCFASNRRPSIYIRANRLKTTTAELAEKLREADVDLDIVPDTPMIRIRPASAITELPGFAEGLFAVQDLTASHAVRMLDPKPGTKILDLCAAPGVKTTQIAEITGDSAQIIATDINPERLRKIEENTTRLGTAGIKIVTYKEFERKASEPAAFDAVLLDVPCSNTGVLAKRIEARYRLNPGAINELTAIQSQLLRTAAPMVKTNGKICYSTCSIQKDENSELIRDFLLQNNNFKLEFEELILPSAETPTQGPHCEKNPDEFDHDGGYVAILVRK